MKALKTKHSDTFTLGRLNQLTQLIIDNPEGGTVNLNSEHFDTVPTDGFFIASRGTQGRHGTQGMLESLRYALRSEMYFGWWKDSNTGITYFDAVNWTASENAADTIAKLENQLAYYNISERKEVRL